MTELTREQIKAALKNYHVNKIYEGLGYFKVSKPTIRMLIQTDKDGFSDTTIKIMSQYVQDEIQRLNKVIGQ